MVKSLRDAEENSLKYGISLEIEILRLVIHGILHMIGYNDIESKDKRKMKRIENELVKNYRTLITN